MQLLTHSGRIANLLLLLSLTVTTGCTVGPWEAEFWQPPPASGVVPIEGGKSYPISRAAGLDSGWPNLADVPERQEPPLTPEHAQAELEALSADRSAASTAGNRQAERGPVSTAPTIPSQTPSPPEEITLSVP